MEFERIKPTEEAVLEALAVYRFLTAKQLLHLGVTTSQAHLYDTLRTLASRKPSLLIELDFGALPVRGRLSRLYVLSQRGAELLSRHGEAEVEAPKQVTLFQSDYFHRVACVDFHIALRLWAERSGLTVDFFHAYYDPVPGKLKGGRPSPKTRIALKSGALIPDAVFSCTDHQRTRRLYTFEMYNEQRTKRVTTQLETYLTALDEEAIRKTYEYEHNERVLVVFDRQENLRLVRQRIKSDPRFAEWQPFFFLAPLSLIRERFYDGWQHLDGTPTTLF